MTSASRKHSSRMALISWREANFQNRLALSDDDKSDP